MSKKLWAILLALITKEVYSSLFVGIVLGALFQNNFNLVDSADTLLQQGLIDSVSGTAGIFIFLVVDKAWIILLLLQRNYKKIKIF